MSKPRTLARSHRVGRARRPRVSVWQQLNQAREIGLGLFGNKRAVLGIVIIALAMGAIVLAQGPLFHSYETIPYQGSDPYTIIWNEPFGSSDISGWNCNRATYTTLGSTTKGINLLSDGNGPALCLSKSSLDLSTAAGRELLFQFGSYTGGAQNIAYGWFLTTNKTLIGIGPDSNYDPSTDSNVALYSRRVNQGSLNFLFNVLIQRDQNVALASSQYPNCEAGKGAGVCFILATLNSGVSGIQNDALDLNFTGTTAPASNNGRSYQQFGATVDLSVLPWLQFQAIPYYIGFFVQKGGYSEIFSYVPVVCAGGCPSGTPANAMYVEVGHETGTAPTVGPQIDSGGFFGPVIRALISMGVFIVTNILGFAVYLYNILAPIGTAIFNLAASGLATIIGIFYNVVKTILNSIGSILGLGTLGDNLFQLLTGLADWFAQFFGTIINIAFSGNLVNALNQILNFNVTLLIPYWAVLTAWLTALGDYLSLFWSTAALFSKISVSMLLSFWLLYGALRFSRSMASGMEWYHTTGYFTMLGISITWYFLVIIINYVIIPIVHIITAGSTTLGARPKIEVAGTSTP